MPQNVTIFGDGAIKEVIKLNEAIKVGPGPTRPHQEEVITTITGTLTAAHTEGGSREPEARGRPPAGQGERPQRSRPC